MDKLAAYRAGFAQGYFEKRAYDPQAERAWDPAAPRETDMYQRFARMAKPPPVSKDREVDRSAPLIPERRLKWYNTDKALIGTPETPENHQIGQLTRSAVIRPFTSLEYYRKEYPEYWKDKLGKLVGLFGTGGPTNPRMGL